MSDLKARIRDAVAFDYVPEATRQVLDDAYGAITELERQLAARDAEIAAWLRGEAAKWDVEVSYAIRFTSDAIESGDYRKDAQ